MGLDVWCLFSIDFCLIGLVLFLRFEVFWCFDEFVESLTAVLSDLTVWWCWCYLGCSFDFLVCCVFWLLVCYLGFWYWFACLRCLFGYLWVVVCFVALCFVGYVVCIVFLLLFWGWLVLWLFVLIRVYRFEFGLGICGLCLFTVWRFGCWWLVRFCFGVYLSVLCFVLLLFWFDCLLGLDWHCVFIGVE